MVGDYPITKRMRGRCQLRGRYTGGLFAVLAPELLNENLMFPGVLGPPVDVWSLGCTVYYLCTGLEICLIKEGNLPKPMEKLLDAVPVRFGKPFARLWVKDYPFGRSTNVLDPLKKLYSWF